MKIGYLGPSGSHSQAAVEQFVQRYLGHVPQPRTLMPMMTLTHILGAVEEHALQMGCIPVENALEGSVAEVLDALSSTSQPVRIIAEFVRPIQHALIRRFEFVEGIAFVHSHPQAIGQCREAIYDLLGPDVKFVPTSSTSEAIRSLLTLDETHAALGAEKAAEQYGLDVVVRNIGNYTHNATRFWVITALEDNPLVELPEAYPCKTSLCVGLDENRPGALLEILNVLARFDLNMTKIESRPTKRILGEYLFYLDIEGPIPQPAAEALRAETSFFKCMGVYPMMGMLTE